MKRFITENLPLKIISVVVGLVLYLFVMQEKEGEREFIVPVRVEEHLSDQVLLTEIPDVRLVVSGRTRHLARLETDVLEELVVRLDQARPTVTFGASDFNLPAGVEVRSIFPDRVQLSYARLTARELPILVNSQGDPHPDYSIVGVRATPQRIRVTGPEDQINELTGVPTSRIDIYETDTDDIERSVGLIATGAHMEYEQVQNIQVVIDIEPNQDTMEMAVALAIEGPSEGFSLEEGADVVRVHLVGPPSVIRSSAPIPVRATVSSAPFVDSEGGRYFADVRVFNLPPGVRLLGVEPTSVALLVAAAEESVRLTPVPIPVLGVLPIPLPTLLITAQRVEQP